MHRSRWPCGLRRSSLAALLLDRRFEYRSEKGCPCLLFVVSCSGSGLCDELITHSEESYRLCLCACVCVCLIVCDLENSTMRLPRLEMGCFAIERIRKYGTAVALPAVPPHLISAEVLKLTFTRSLKLFHFLDEPTNNTAETACNAATRDRKFFRCKKVPFNTVAWSKDHSDSRSSWM